MTQNNSESTITPTIESRFHFFPTAWDPGVAQQLFDTLVGPDKLYPATAWGNEGGDPLPSDTGELIELLTERYEASHKANRITLFTDLPFRIYSFELHRSEWDEDSGLGQRLFWPKQLTLSAPVDAIVTDESLDALAQVAAITNAPLVELDYRTSWAVEPLSVAARAELKRVVQGTVHAKAAAGPWRGLHRIPWRLILGVDIVRTIGAAKLAALPAEHARDHGNGIWTLQTTATPADSITEQGRAAEQLIIRSLGPEFFCDTTTNRLATVPPDFPIDLIPNDQLAVDRYGEQLKPL